MTIPRVAAGLLLLCGVLAAAGPATVIVVRHAERGGGMTDDVGLSEAGRCRAGVLARMLADTGIRRIYVTEVARTQQTAEPLARKLNIRPEVVPARDYDALLGKLRNAEGPALVVGHSNTIPEIISRLGAGATPAIPDDAYDRMYVITMGQTPALLRLHYPGCE